MTVKLIAFGALAGLAWAASLRGYMAELAGPASRVDWFGTFGLILLPGLLVGAALGWAEALRRDGGRRGWRWLAATPLVFPVLALTPAGALETFLTTGIGGGSIALVLTGMLGGFAISGPGALWTRVIAGTVAAAGLAAGVVGGVVVRPQLALTEPRGLWVGLLALTLTVLLALACSIPHRAVAPRRMS